MVRVIILVIILSMNPLPASRYQREGFPKAELHLILDTNLSSVGAGDAIPVQVRIVNRGLYPEYVGKKIGSYRGAPSRLDILVRNESGEEDEGISLVVGLGSTVQENWWVELHHGYFVGVETSVTPESYPIIRKPGTFTIRARYVSKGGSVQGVNGINDSVWEGELLSNTVEVRVVPWQKK